MKKSNNYFVIVIFEYFLISALLYAAVSLVSFHVQFWNIRKNVLAQLHLVIWIACENLGVQDVNSWNGEVDCKVISVV